MILLFSSGVDGVGTVIDGGTASQTTGDTIDYSALTDKVSLRLMGSSYSSVTLGAESNHHSIRNINNVIGSQVDDTIEGDLGNNTLDGNSGNDTISFQNSGAKVVVNIGAEVTLNSSIYTANQATGNTIGTDKIVYFENILSGSGDDTLIGSSGLNYIYGGLGNDFIYGGAGDDKLYGEEGNDTIVGGVGYDTIDGGAGIDTVSYFDASSVTLSLRGSSYGTATATYSGVSYNDRLYSIENVIGSSGDDTIQGNEEDNVLDGAGGKNTVSYSGAAAGVTVDLGITAAQNTGDGNDTLLNFSNLTGSSQDDILKGNDNSNIIKGGNGADTIYGIGGSNFLYGEAGNDTFIGKLTGSDFIDGESGNDKVDYSNLLAANSIRVNLGTTTTINSQTVYEISKIDGDSDYVKNISIFEGSAGNDIFTVTNGTYEFIGGSGDDTFNGTNFTGVVINGSNHTIDSSGTQGAINAYATKGDTDRKSVV